MKDHGLLQRLYGLRLFLALAKLPVVDQFIFVKFVPFQDMVKCSFRKLSFNYSCVDIYSNFISRIFCMKMWWNMIIPVHRYDDSKESTDYRHVLFNFSCVERDCFILTKRKLWRRPFPHHENLLFRIPYGRSAKVGRTFFVPCARVLKLPVHSGMNINGIHSRSGKVGL